MNVAYNYYPHTNNSILFLIVLQIILKCTLSIQQCFYNKQFIPNHLT